METCAVHVSLSNLLDTSMNKTAIGELASAAEASAAAQSRSEVCARGRSSDYPRSGKKECHECQPPSKASSRLGILCIDQAVLALQQALEEALPGQQRPVANLPTPEV